jgi:dienelactone hydrolase
MMDSKDPAVLNGRADLVRDVATGAHRRVSDESGTANSFSALTVQMPPLRLVAPLAVMALAPLVAASGARAQTRTTRAPLPHPAGRYAVGTEVLHVVDSSRATSRSIHTRPLTVQAWYPAQRGTGTDDVRYVERALLDSMMSARYLDLDSAAMRGWADVRVDARSRATSATPPSARGWPVVVLSHGMGVARANYTAIAEELASHGYVVLAVDHPIGGFTLAPGGRVLRPGIDSLHYPDHPLASIVRDWAIDDALVVRRATMLLGHGAGGVARVVLDTSRVAAIGHSLGGAAALQACLAQPLFDACADMDGAVFGDVETERIGKPILVLLSEPDHADRPPPRDSAEAARRERFAQMGRERDSTWTAICARQGDAPCYVAKLTGTGHFSFSDAPFQIPSELQGVGATLTPAAMHRAMADRLLTFLGATIRVSASSTRS